MNRAELAVAANRNVDDVGLNCADVVVTDAPFVESAGAEVLHDDVGSRGESQENLAALGLAEIERQVALVAIHRRLREADLLVVTGERRRDAPRHFTLASLDFDDVGA